MILFKQSKLLKNNENDFTLLGPLHSRQREECLGGVKALRSPFAKFLRYCVL